jgi:small redox-active disulfide protein 2
MKMKRLLVLGAGCPQCTKLRKTAEAAVRRLGIDATVEQTGDLSVILTFDVLLTPALVIDGAVKVVGRVPSADEIQRLLKET